MDFDFAYTKILAYKNEMKKNYKNIIIVVIDSPLNRLKPISIEYIGFRGVLEPSP